MAPSTSARTAPDARANERATERSNDSAPTRELLRTLWRAMRNGQEESIALFSTMHPSTLRRQHGGELRGLLDLAGTELALLDRAQAMEVLERFLDGHRLRVRPEPLG